MTPEGVDALVKAVRQQIAAEGLRPFAMRTGIPLGQLRSLVQGRASRYTTLESIASVMGMRLLIGPAEWDGEAPQLPEAITKALHLPSDASPVDAVGLIQKDALASRLRDGLRVVQELTQRAALTADLMLRLVGGSTPARMMPFAEHVRLRTDTGEVEFEKSADLSIGVAERVLPSWARADHLTCVRVVGDSTEPTNRDGDLVVIDKERRTPVEGQLFVVRTAEELVVKRLRRVGRRWSLVSEDRSHGARAMAAGDVILGRVAWSNPHGGAQSSDRRRE